MRNVIGTIIEPTGEPMGSVDRSVFTQLFEVLPNCQSTLYNWTKTQRTCFFSISFRKYRKKKNKTT